MSSYRKISPSIWEGDFAAAVAGNANAIALAFYLMTTRHNVMGLGLFRCPNSYVAEDLGMTLGAVEAAADALERIGFARYDDQRKVWWVTKQALIEWGAEFNAAANRVKGLRSYLADHLADLRKSDLVSAFCAHYRQVGDWSLVLPVLADEPGEAVVAQGASLPKTAPSVSFRCRDGVETLSDPEVDAIAGAALGSETSRWARAVAEELSVAPTTRRPKRKNLLRWLKDRAEREESPVPSEALEEVEEGLHFGLRGLAHYTGSAAKSRPFSESTQAGSTRLRFAAQLVRQLGPEKARRAARNLVLSPNHNGTGANGAEYLDLEYVARRPEWFFELCPGDDRAFAARLRKALAGGSSDAPPLPTLAEVEASAST